MRLACIPFCFLLDRKLTNFGRRQMVLVPLMVIAVCHGISVATKTVIPVQSAENVEFYVMLVAAVTTVFLWIGLGQVRVAYVARLLLFKMLPHLCSTRWSYSQQRYETRQAHLRTCLTHWPAFCRHKWCTSSRDYGAPYKAYTCSRSPSSLSLPAICRPSGVKLEITTRSVLKCSARCLRRQVKVIISSHSLPVFARDQRPRGARHN